MVLEPTKYWTKQYPHIEQEKINGWRYRFFSRMVKDHGIKSVLDIGCSTAGALHQIANDCPDVKLAGIDISSHAIAIAEKRLPDAELVWGDIKGDKLDVFADQAYDLVLTSGVLIYNNHQENAEILKHISRIAKKFILHIELYGGDRKYQQNKGNTMYVNNFGRMYDRFIGPRKMRVLDLSQILLDNPHVGEAKHLLWLNLGESELSFRVPEAFR